MKISKKTKIMSLYVNTWAYKTTRMR